MKKIDLAGKRFGHLLVISDTGRRSGSSVIWHCQCDCGREADIAARNLLHRGTVSCGCNRREKSSVNLAGDRAEKFGQVDGTNASRLASHKPQVNNKSGYRGVSWHPFPRGGGKWIAVIYFQGTRYRLGFYDTPKQANEVYKQAKRHIHGDFLAWYNTVKIQEDAKNAD